MSDTLFTNTLDVLADLVAFRGDHQTPAEQVATVERKAAARTLADFGHVARQIASHGRYEDTVDITAEMGMAATAYAREYTGGFEFMVDMRSAARRGPLSIRQVKGTLNCWIADLRRQAEAAPAVEGRMPVTEAGYYFDGADVFVVVSNKAGTNLYAKKYCCPEHAERASWVYAGGAINRLDAADKITAERCVEIAGHLNGRCFRCGRALDLPKSVERGMGNTCWKKTFGA